MRSSAARPAPPGLSSCAVAAVTPYYSASMTRARFRMSAVSHVTPTHKSAQRSATPPLTPRPPSAHAPPSSARAPAPSSRSFILSRSLCSRYVSCLVLSRCESLSLSFSRSLVLSRPTCFSASLTPSLSLSHSLSPSVISLVQLIAMANERQYGFHPLLHVATA